MGRDDACLYALFITDEQGRGDGEAGDYEMLSDGSVVLIGAASSCLMFRTPC